MPKIQNTLVILPENKVQQVSSLKWSQFKDFPTIFYSFISPTDQDHMNKIKKLAVACWQTKLTAGIVGFLPKATFFDMDATVIREETIDCLAAEAGSGETVRKITAQAMAGEIDFNDALIARVRTLTNLPLDKIEKLKLTLNPGIEKLTSYLNNQQVPSFLISGGFMELAEPIGKKLGMTKTRANRLAHNGRILTGELDGPLINGQSKKDFVQEVAALNNWSLADLCAVGDGANDKAMLQSTGLAVGFYPKPALFSYLDLANFTGDHCFLIDCFRLISR